METNIKRVVEKQFNSTSELYSFVLNTDMENLKKEIDLKFGHKTSAEIDLINQQLIITYKEHE